jgi:site-specific DNA-methyltransferase (adenine-specific)
VITVHTGDNLEVLGQFRSGTFDFIYIDPPFNTGRAQARTRLKTTRDEQGSRTGFAGRRYSTVQIGSASYINEIVWAYDYGARTTKRWSPKHDTILWYAKDPERFTFHAEASDRLPYMAPGLVTPEKRKRGKLPTDTWWHTIVSPTGKEKTGYPTQKPLGILERIVKVHTDPDDRLLDYFAGSGSFGDAADKHGRSCVLVDSNPAAIKVMRKRFGARAVFA